MNKEEKAKKAVKEIVSDLSDRGGIGQEWDQIDDATKREIRKTWAEIIVREMSK